VTPATFQRIAKALADDQRFRLLETIAAAAPGERCCSELVECCEVSQATVSHHLKELLAAELLDRRKDGQYAYFRFRAEAMQGYLDELQRRLRLSMPVGSRP
jgi:ArsR family transcriptional regulator